MSTGQQPPTVVCPHCQTQLKAPALPPGSRVACPSCRQPFTYSTPDSSNPQSAIPNPQSPPTVDPLMLGPVARPKPPTTPQDIAVVCRLCGTRMYAPETEIGQTMPCPDCHTINEIKPPRTAAKKPAGPTLEGAEEYALSDPGERPAYRPLVAARGDYAELAEFEPGAHPPGWTKPEAPAKAAAEPAAEEEDEFKLAAPVERVETKPEIVIPHVPLPERGAVPGGKETDDLLGHGVDLKQPEAWKKAPFLVGLLGFLAFPSTLVRLSVSSVGLAVALILTHQAIENGMSSGATGSLLAILLTMGASLAIGLWALPFSASLLAIVQDTANGQDEVTGWPDWNPFEWFGMAVYFPLAGCISGLPGGVLSAGLMSAGMPLIAAPLPVIVSWVVLFPLVLYSMLAEASCLMPFSVQTGRSFRIAGEAWMLFYIYSLAIGLALALAYGLAAYSNVAAQAAGAVAIVALTFLYCRVLGRLMWYTSEKEARLTDPQTANR